MKSYRILFLCLCVALSFSSFRTDQKMQLVNNSKEPLNEEIFNRLLLKSIKNDIKDLPVMVTVVSFYKTSEPVHLGGHAEELKTTRVNYHCELILKIGESTQKIKRNEHWEGRLGTIATAPPSDEQLIVDLLRKHLDHK